VTGGPVEIFFNGAASAVTEHPCFAGQPIGATGTLLIEVEGTDALHARAGGEDRDADRDAILRDA